MDFQVWEQKLMQADAESQELTNEGLMAVHAATDNCKNAAKCRLIF